MHLETPTNTPRAFIIGTGGVIYPDTLVCSGIVPAELGGHACPFSENGRMPRPQPLDASDPTYSIDKGHPGDVCPPCAKQQLASLSHWHGHGGQQFPAHLLPLRLFKCRQWFWLVVPGLRHDQPTADDRSMGEEPQPTPGDVLA